MPSEILNYDEFIDTLHREIFKDVKFVANNKEVSVLINVLIGVSVIAF